MNIYIDESGSINGHNNENDRLFFITLIQVENDNSDKLRKMYKRFVSSHFEHLKKIDKRGKMFRNNKFVELKGSQLDPQTKHEFIYYFARYNLFNIHLIILDNKYINPKFFINKSRSFNYMLCKTLTLLTAEGCFCSENYNIQLDERNEKLENKTFLENYLNTEIYLGTDCNTTFSVQYFDSSKNPLIQIADVFSNIFYSSIHTKTYDEDIQFLKENGYLKSANIFPPEVDNVFKI